MNIAIDFDDTLMDNRNIAPGYRMGIPNTGSLYALNKLVSDSHRIYIFTARNVSDPNIHKSVTDWLDYFKIPYEGVTNIKQPFFDLMIDNRALHFSNWPQVLTDIDMFKVNQPIANSFAKEHQLIDDISKELLT